MVFASAIFLEDPTKKQNDVQRFPNLGFKLKVVALRKHRNAARLFFLNMNDPDDSDRGVEIPEHIKVKDFSDNEEECEPWPNTNDFYIDFLHTYQVHYMGIRIYQLNCEKKIQIHMFPKNIGIVETGDSEKITELIKEIKIKKEKKEKKENVK